MELTEIIREWLDNFAREWMDFQVDEKDLAGRIEEAGWVRSQWIPVTERLPEIGIEVLVWSSNGWASTDVRRTAPKYWKITDYWDSGLSDAEITHWQPLPAPPKEGA